MADDADDLIRFRAYEIWQAEGSPHGRDADHWLQASRELAEAQADAHAEQGSSAPPHAPPPSPGPDAPARRGRKPAAPTPSAPGSKGRRKKNG